MAVGELDESGSSIPSGKAIPPSSSLQLSTISIQVDSACIIGSKYNPEGDRVKREVKEAPGEL